MYSRVCVHVTYRRRLCCVSFDDRFFSLLERHTAHYPKEAFTIHKALNLVLIYCLREYFIQIYLRRRHQVGLERCKVAVTRFFATIALIFFYLPK